MNDLVNEGLLIEEYILRRMVYVNSAGHGYSEILLDDHLAMFGENNVGKTASLAGTKLLLYPESNLRNCESKFRFEGKEGAFTMEESYQFYFPDPKSFIILEVQNPEGMFCMVLYKNNNYTYSRLFIPLAYGDLRHLFWSKDNEDFNENLSIASIKEFTQAQDGLQVKDETELRSLMFGSARSDSKRNRFCVLPLKEATLDSVEAFRHIYQLAFDTSNKKTKTLPTAIATLLEMGRGRDEEKLNSNLTELNEQYSKLIAKKDYLDSLNNARPYYERAFAAYEKFDKAHIIYSQAYQSTKNAIQNAKESYVAQHSEIKAQYDEQLKALEKINDKLENANRESQRLEGRIEEKQVTLKRDKEKSVAVKRKCSSYGEKIDFSNVVSTLKKQAKKLKIELEQYREENGLQTLLKDNINRRNQCIKNKDKAEAFINDTSSAFLHKLDDKHSASILLSLNSEFSELTLEITENIASTVKQFAKLFDKTDQEQLKFLDTPFSETRYVGYSESESVERAKEKIEELKSEIQALDNDISKYNKALKTKDFDKLISETDKELKTVTKDIDDINGLPILINRIEELEKNIASSEGLAKEKSIEVEQLITQRSDISSKYNQLNHMLRKLDDENSLIQYGDRQLEAAFLICDVLASSSPEKASISQEQLDKVSEQAKSAKELKDETLQNLRLVISQVEIPEVDPHKQLTSSHDINHVMGHLKDIYTTLEYELSQYQNEIQSHNRFVSSQLNELRASKDFLRNFINEINGDLNGQQVSNLSEIKLTLAIHPAFSSLLDTLDKHDIEDASLLDDSFYDALAHFVDKFFDKRKKRLKMKDIIESISYEYTLKKTGKQVNKSQSGGTSSTITAFVLSVLLNRITPSYVKLKMPIIVDEVSTLDFKNTKATIKQIADHGFSIFCATPAYSGYICSKVGRWITIDRSTIQRPIVDDCYLNILPQHIEKFGAKPNAT